MKIVLLFLYIFHIIDGCSTSKTSKNGWDINAIEDEILDMRIDLEAAMNKIKQLEAQTENAERQIDNLEEKNNVLTTQIAIIEAIITCPSGTEISVCQCPSGFVNVPHIQNEQCVDEQKYRCEIKEPYNQWRLPTTDDGKPVAVPIHYDVDLEFSGLYESDKIDGNFYFNGTSTVEFVLNDDVCSFNLHVNGEYDIMSLLVFVDGSPASVTFTLNTDYQYLTVFGDYKILMSSNVRVTVTYRVRMPTGLIGLYLAHYQNNEGQTRYLAATQFETIGARMAFPCFDEPGLKATFTFSIKYKYDEYSAIFNTGVIRSTSDGTWTTNYYETTMLMPTYLLAILVSDYHLESKGVSDKGVHIRIVGRKGWEDQTEFALQEALTIVDAMSDKFQYDYCRPFEGGECKSDQAAIPQFSFGAMENWGLITYREYYLFINEKRDPFLRKRAATSLIGHELIHMWFGNTVSCPWWDELYINEAFGSIGGYLGLIFAKSNDEIDYQWEDEYLQGQTYSALITDGRPNSRPMVNNANNGDLRVETPSEISGQFDGIGYDKSGSIMLMIRALIGDDLWTSGLVNYLYGQEFGSANWAQLLGYWDDVLELQDPALNLDGMTITEIMQPYFRQMGYPVLKIQSKARTCIEDDLIIIQTSRFLESDDSKLLPQSEFGYKWSVPLVIEENGLRRIHWMHDAGENNGLVYEVPIISGAILNPDGNIFMRMNVDSIYLTEMISNHWLNERELTARNIAKLFQDHYRMLLADTVGEFDVTIRTLLDMTWFLRGPNPGDIDGQKHRWLIWKEVDQMNIFQTLHTKIHSYLYNSDSTSAEFHLFESYMAYMYSKVNFVDNYYPDKYPTDDNSQSSIYDVSKARMTEFVLSMAMRYGDQTASIFSSAHKLAMLTVEGNWTFLDQSPDTRIVTFKAAVAYESEDSVENRSVINYLIGQISYAIESGSEIMENIRACTNKDVTNVIVPLYTGNCMLNTYFIALASVENLATAMHIKNALPLDLQADYLMNLASNPKLTRAVVSSYQNLPISQIETEFKPEQLNRFIRNGCNHLSSISDNIETGMWIPLVFTEAHQERVNAALTTCNTTWIGNNEFMLNHYEDLIEWFCENNLANCDDLVFELYPFGFNVKEFNEWYLPRDEATGQAVYQPSHYEVSLDFDGLKEEDKVNGSLYFRGESTVHFTNTAKISTINIHVDIEDAMTIEESKVFVDGNEVQVLHTHHNSNYQLLTVYLERTVISGSLIKLWTKYVVTMSDEKNHGLYLSYFTNDNGIKEYLAITQFASTFAREAFPCFDEPNLKATFDFKLKYRYRNEFTAIFNTDVKSSEEIGPDARENTYYRTMKMSTYLVAILVSTFNVEATGTSAGGTSIRILGRQDWKNETNYALNEAMSIVDSLGEYFDYHYCLPLLQADGTKDINGTKCKLDHAGIPTFNFGAMENWGLVTYREYYLHYNAKRDPFLVRRTITRIIAHEIMHQWFGNLVTCPWWDEVYINEAFGSIGGYLGMFLAESMAEVDYDWEAEYLATQTFDGLEFDGKNSSRPMVNNMNNGELRVTNPTEILSQYDKIAYNKGGSIMLMIREIIGGSLWRTGLQKYLKGQEFDTSNWQQLLRYWDAAIAANQTDEANLLDPKYTVEQIFEPYFKQMGYPLLHITKKGYEFKIRTERFLDHDGDKGLPESAYNYTWHVPLITQSIDGKSIYWLEYAGNTDITYTFNLPLDTIIDPNAKNWLRITYENYVENSIDYNWQQEMGASRTAANIAKMMQGFVDII